MTKDFQRMNIPKLPVFTTEDGIKRIKEFFGKLIDWKNINDLIPSKFKSGLNIKELEKQEFLLDPLNLLKKAILQSNKIIYLMKFMLRKLNEQG